MTPTHLPNHPPSHTSTLRWSSLHSSKIFKQNWIILICLRIIFSDLTPPPWGGVFRWVGEPHTHVHVHACMHTHMYRQTHTHMLNMIHMDASMEASMCNSWTCYFFMNACACLCGHAYACVCMWGTPYPSTPTPVGPQITEIIQFCLKICDLRTFLHSYRLGLVCRRGCLITNSIFFTFGPETELNYLE